MRVEAAVHEALAPGAWVLAGPALTASVGLHLGTVKLHDGVASEGVRATQASDGAVVGPARAVSAAVAAGAPARDPAMSLHRARAQWGARGDLWVFGYASLIWRPEFTAVEQRAARVHGFHRALKMRSRVNRGTPECPGLVFALLSGGSCRGVVFRISRERVDEELPRLWAREMPNAVYDARWLRCRTAQGPVLALGFTLDRDSPNFTGALEDEQMLDILRSASGRYGSTLAYLLETASGLAANGIRDQEIDRLVALARRHQLAS